MVHVADNSLYGYGYREINQQLAKDNGELRQQLSLAFQENSQQRIELHRKDVELISLRQQVAELSVIKEKYNAIKEIITCNKRPMKSIEGPPQPHKRLTFENGDKNGDDDDDDDGEHGDDKYEEEGVEEEDEKEEEEEEEEGGDDESPQPVPTSTTQNTDQSMNILQPIEEEDSLDPPDVTSVPPITQDDRTLQTPSIWNCLDTLAPEPSPIKCSPVKVASPMLKAMFESTPVQPPLSTALTNAQHPRNLVRDSDKRGSYEQQQQQQPQQPQQPTRYNLRKRTKR